mmetsp:Transcript_4869/g.13837  ORF Transcript_4869/g.13837 Transcript_4869/m.13837 type:complete len:244 (+) Transcript_4869:256-987(+)
MYESQKSPLALPDIVKVLLADQARAPGRGGGRRSHSHRGRGHHAREVQLLHLRVGGVLFIVASKGVTLQGGNHGLEFRDRGRLGCHCSFLLRRGHHLVDDLVVVLKERARVHQLEVQVLLLLLLLIVLVVLKRGYLLDLRLIALLVLRNGDLMLLLLDLNLGSVLFSWEFRGLHKRRQFGDELRHLECTLLLDKSNSSVHILGNRSLRQLRTHTDDVGRVHTRHLGARIDDVGHVRGRHWLLL